MRPPAARITHKPNRRIATRRIGTEYGGRVIPDGLLSRDSVCYCVGAGEDLSFDLGLAKNYGSSVWILDPTPRAVAHFEQFKASTHAGKAYPINRDPDLVYDANEADLARLHFLPFGLWSKDETLKFYAPADSSHVSHSIVNLQRTTSFVELPVRRMKNVMNELGHDRVDLLKLDIEGAEFAVLETVLDDKLDIAAICSEYDEWHHPLDANADKRINASIARMKKGGYVLADIDNECNVMFIRNDIFQKLRA